jgi:hypothetical protein
MAVSSIYQLGSVAYATSSVYRDIHDTFQYPAFQRLLSLIKDDCTADTVKLFLHIYNWIDDTCTDLNSMEKIGQLKQMIDNGKTRQVLVQKYMHRKGVVCE